MRNEKAKTTAAAITIIVALGVLYLALRAAPPRVDPRPHLALAQGVADEAAKLLAGGGRISIIALDAALHKNPVADLQMKGFRRAIKQAGLTLAATHAIKLDPNRLVRVPPGDFFDILRRQADGDVVVSFLGPPVDLTPDQRAKLAGKKLRIVAVCSGGMPRQVNLKELFQQGLLQVAILSRLNPSSELPATDIRQAWFDHFFQIVTSANLADLPLPTDNQAPR